MTRGYVVILNNSKIEKAGYSNSDSYFSWLGVKVIDAIKKNTLSEFVDELIKDYPDELTNINFSWYRKTKENKDDWFVDYVYEYDTKKKKLTIYYYGTKALTFKIPEDLEVIDYIFNNYDEIWKKLSYNDEKLDYSNDDYKKLRQMQKEGRLTAAEIKKECNAVKNDIIFEFGRICDCWPDSYKKVIRDEQTGRRMEFAISKNSYNDKYRIVIQLPYVRNSILKEFGSPKTAEKTLIEFVRNNAEKLKINMLIFELYREIIRFYDEHETDQEAAKKATTEYITKINEVFDTHDCFYTQSFKKDAVEREIQNRYYRTYVKKN